MAASSSSLQRILCAFDNERSAANAAQGSSGTSLAVVSADNRLRIFDTISGTLRGGRDYAEPHHLTAEYTCIAFHSPRSKKATGNKLGVVALGRADGVIIIWNLQTADITRLGDGNTGHRSRVTDVTFNDAGSVLYSSGGDKQLLEWNVSTGKLERTRPFRYDDNDDGSDNTSSSAMVVSRLAYHNTSTSLLAAGTGITLWDLTTRTIKLTFLGHAAAVTCVAWTPDARYFASGK